MRLLSLAGSVVPLQRNGGGNFSTSSKQFIRANGDTRNRLPVLPDIFVKADGKGGDAVPEAAIKWLAL